MSSTEAIKEFVNLGDVITQEEHAQTGNALHRSVYTGAVLTGKDMPIGNYPKKYLVTEVESKVQQPRKSHIGYTSSEIKEFYLQVSSGETNPLFKAAFAKLGDVAKTNGYSTEEFFRMAINFGIFSFFGREEFIINFVETKFKIEIVLQYIDPSLDEPDIIKLELKEDKKPKIFQNRKYVTIIFNKQTGIVAKCELTNRYSNAIWIWNCRSRNMIFTHYGRISYNHTLKMYFESIVTNVFFSNHGNYPILREDIISSVKEKTVTVSKYINPVEGVFKVDPEEFHKITKSEHNADFLVKKAQYDADKKLKKEEQRAKANRKKAVNKINNLSDEEFSELAAKAKDYSAKLLNQREIFISKGMNKDRAYKMAIKELYSEYDQETRYSITNYYIYREENRDSIRKENVERLKNMTNEDYKIIENMTIDYFKKIKKNDRGKIDLDYTMDELDEIYACKHIYSCKV